MTGIEGRTRLLITVALLGPLAGCTALRSGQAAGGEEIIEYGTPTGYLTCSQPGAGGRAEMVIGPQGGRLQAGVSELVIPAEAVLEERRFVLQQEPGDTVGVTIDGIANGAQPARLRRSATLRIDVSGCDANTLAHPQGWWVWRMSNVAGGSQKLRTRISPREATTVIDSTSRFMIAH